MYKFLVKNSHLLNYAKYYYINYTSKLRKNHKIKYLKTFEVSKTDLK